MEYILSLSYGKDSLACLGAIEELGWPLGDARRGCTTTILSPVKAPQSPRAGRVSTPRHSQENATGEGFGANWGIRKEIP
jgi:hypothetical protein